MGFPAIEGVESNLMSTDECLLELCKWGQPRLSKFDKGWHCAIEVFVSGQGAKFEVSTKFDQETANQAVNNCYSLLIKAVNKIKETN